MIYLDNAATTFPKPESVYAAQDRIARTLAVNAGRGSYRASSEASRIIADCRSKMARLAGCREDNLAFAPSATVAMNQIILGLPWNQYSVVYVSPYEHNAVARPLNHICKLQRVELRKLSTKEDGQLDLEKIAIQFAKSSLLLHRVSAQFRQRLKSQGTNRPLNRIFQFLRMSKNSWPSWTKYKSHHAPRFPRHSTASGPCFTAVWNVSPSLSGPNIII